MNCGTQNANESLHNMIWAKCPKESVLFKERVKRCVTKAVCEYNKGSLRSIKDGQKGLGVSLGKYSMNPTLVLDSRFSKKKCFDTDDEVKNTNLHVNL